MDGKNRGALRRILREVKEYRELPTNMIGGDDIYIVERFLKNEERTGETFICEACGAELNIIRDDDERIVEETCPKCNN